MRISLVCFVVYVGEFLGRKCDLKKKFKQMLVLSIVSHWCVSFFYVGEFFGRKCEVFYLFVCFF